jgi:hypothetical protein
MYAVDLIKGSGPQQCPRDGQRARPDQGHRPPVRRISFAIYPTAPSCGLSFLGKRKDKKMWVSEALLPSRYLNFDNLIRAHQDTALDHRRTSRTLWGPRYVL